MDIAQKAKKIKALVFDVDGVLTDGKIIYAHDAVSESTAQAREIKQFNVKDGLIIAQMRKMGYITGVITGRNSAVVRHRSQELNVSFHYHGAKRKTTHYEEIKQQYQLSDEQIAYVGDDIPDLGVLSRCGLSVCPADASIYVRERVDYITKANGGEGVIRELGELILQSQGRMQELVNLFLHE